MTSPAEIMGNFTPLPDILVKQYGLTAAAVWGRIWRYSCGERGVCDAAITTIANELNISRETVRVHVNCLEGDGYIVDTTPDRKGQPHAYRTTRKIAIELRLAVGDNEPARNSGNHLPENLATPARISGTKRQVTDNSKRQDRRERDPLLDNPAIQLYREVVKYHVPAVWREKVAQTVTNPELWKQILIDWIGHGYNPRNIKGELDAYQKGYVNGNGRTISRSPAYDPTNGMSQEDIEISRRMLREARNGSHLSEGV